MEWCLLFSDGSEYTQNLSWIGLSGIEFYTDAN